MKKQFAYLFAFCFSVATYAQQNWTKARQEIHNNILFAGSNYLAYVDPTEALTPAPKGYEPFYLTHYGRHGSRWLCNDSQYTDVLGVLNRAHEKGKLTERGEKLRDQLTTFYNKSAYQRAGELSGVGERQHHRIGKRMTERFPEIFGAKDCRVDARSTVVIRCILSMEAECEELCKFNSNIAIHNDVSEGLQYYLNASWEKRINEGNSAKWQHVFDYNKEYVHPERFWSMLMNDAEYRDEKINSRSSVMKRIFDIVCNMQSHFGNSTYVIDEGEGRSNDAIGTGLDSYTLFDLYTEDEVYNLWRCKNIEWYVNYSSGISPMTQKNLLQNFLATADTITGKAGYHGATLRFGHEVCVMPLAAILELGQPSYTESQKEAAKENLKCYPEVPMEGLDTLDRVWANYRIFPMGSNVQLIFYHPKKGKMGDILVKALLNEREVSLPVATDSYPYYRWADLEAYYKEKIK